MQATNSRADRAAAGRSHERRSAAWIGRLEMGANGAPRGGDNRTGHADGFQARERRHWAWLNSSEGREFCDSMGRRESGHFGDERESASDGVFWQAAGGGKRVMN